MKENSSWLIPYSIDEVKVWDTIVMSYWSRRKVIERIPSKPKCPIKLKRINKNFSSWMEMYTDCEWMHIDRRKRYKRLLDSLFWISV